MNSRVYGLVMTKVGGVLARESDRRRGAADHMRHALSDPCGASERMEPNESVR